MYSDKSSNFYIEDVFIKMHVTLGDIFVKLKMGLIASDVIQFESEIRLKPSASKFSVPGLYIISKFATSAIHL